MFRFFILSVTVLPVLAFGLAIPQIAHAQGDVDSLLDSAPGVGPPARERREDRSDRDDGFPDDDGGLRDGDPELEDLLDRLDRRSGSGSGRRDRERTEPDDFDLDDDDRDRPRRRDRERDRDEEPDDPDFRKAEPDLGHKVIAGLWTGTVEEVGADPYVLSLSLKEDGTGTAAYPNLNCAGDVVPIAGRLLEYRETITQGREKCSDGIVQLRLRRGMLLWTWKDDSGEVRAAATLHRSVEAPTGKAAAGDTMNRNVIGDGFVAPPQAVAEQPPE